MVEWTQTLAECMVQIEARTHSCTPFKALPLRSHITHEVSKRG